MVQVMVKSQTNQPYKQAIKAGKHDFLADAPVSAGGGETGPDPHELLLGALGSCTAITLQMFANRRQWDLNEVSVKLKEEKVDDPEQPGRQISKISREIELKGNLNQEQIEALKAAADKCLIHKLLTGPKEIVSNVSHAG